MCLIKKEGRMTKEEIKKGKELLDSIEDSISLTEMIQSFPEGFDDERIKPARESIAKATPVILKECKDFINLAIGVSSD